MIKYGIEEGEDCNALVLKNNENTSFLFQYPCIDTTSCKPYNVLLEKGLYKFELWGAEGGLGRYQNTPNLRENSAGKGAYVSGLINIPSSTNIFVYIGGKGEDQSSIEQNAFGRGGWNGG